MAASDSGPFGALGWVIVLGGVTFAGILWGLVHVPPYFANREIETAVNHTLSAVNPTTTDTEVLSQINQVLTSTKTSRYWVEDDGAHDAMDFSLKPDDIVFTRDGNRQISADVHYTQEMMMPLLKRRTVMEYAFHVDGPVR